VAVKDTNERMCWMYKRI